MAFNVKEKEPRREEIVDLISSSLRAHLSQKGIPIPDPLNESTPLIGYQSVVDSLGLVTLVTEIEQKLDEQYDACIILADDQAMSQKNSPFQTIQSLTDHIASLIQQEETK